ncbi:Ribonuclease III family protein [Euphorbia peplus]|nr:Ribonuclease III family protein [Euphorbia peplus]
MSLVRIRASWDTQFRVPYNPNAPRKPKKSPISQPSTFNPSPPPSSSSLSLTPQSVSELLKRNTIAQGVLTKSDETYLGYDTWMPKPPKVEKPRSIFNAAALAYIGDSIFELYARRHFLFPPLSIEEYNTRVMAVVRSEAQDALLRKLLSDTFLTEKEREVLRWGKNSGSAKTRTKKRVGTALYNRASSLETLIGYLYLTNANRLEELMLNLGFSSDSSTQVILEEADRLESPLQVGDNNGAFRRGRNASKC